MRVNAMTNHNISKVFIDDRDYTQVCFEADDEENWAKCYKWVGYPKAPSPNVQMDDRERVVTVYGKVRFVFDEVMP